MPPRVFMPIRRRRRPSEIQEIDPLVKRMTHGSLLIGLGFVIILGGVLVTIFAMKPKTVRYRRPMKTYVIGESKTPPPLLNSDLGSSSALPHAETELNDGLNLSLVLGPILAISGVTISIAGAILYAVSYKKKKRKDKATIQRITDEEVARDTLTTSGGETSGVTITFPEVATSVSDVQLSVTSSQGTATTPVTGL